MAWLSDVELTALFKGMQRVKDKHRLRCAFDDCACDVFKFASTFQQLPTCMTILLPDFGGVFPSNELPKHCTEPVSYIFNSDPSNKPGEHWMAYYQQNNQCDFFDSYGQPLETYPSIYSWLKDSPFKVNRLTRRIQGPSAVCGAYCFYFLKERPWHTSMETLLFENPTFPFQSIGTFDNMNDEQLKTYLGLNDAYVFAYLYQHVQDMIK